MRRVDLHSNSGCNAACTTRHSADAGDLAWHAQARADQASSSRTHVSEPRYRPRHQKACCFECLSWPPCCTISVQRPTLCTSYLQIGLRFPSRCVCVSSVWHPTWSPECRGRVPAASLAHSRKVVCHQYARQKTCLTGSEWHNAARSRRNQVWQGGGGRTREVGVGWERDVWTSGMPPPKTTENHVSIPGDRAFKD
ncbi:hypothetical protein BGZ61DRAFT_68407 [Ilyonectria robusta]|uniref:uncharacterized protein n=1 Tax=Ilyonectria robusta TaxID=1079257 RepID=UPI001E8D9D13|nr:uncharacterized protein BGZ61DRAFT_68407 [Ilyonectria robusta]KAH8679155.1 hypothetical protein BGZ61DRAFT_68407 [Ilyonectria robusta]